LKLSWDAIIIILTRASFCSSCVSNRTRLRHNQVFRAILSGVNSAAVGLVGAACIILWESAIEGSADAIIFSVALTMSVIWSVSAPLCVVAGGVLGAILHPDALNLGQRPSCVDNRH